ncbi:MAG: hypothetical protein JW783_06040 [Bacteroidales bacterium]|nr:hypothetical protein [Bacteroidales bacterium]MBN2750276.1 hypothetical protein [Bacteroidales bacterium]
MGCIIALTSAAFGGKLYAQDPLAKIAILKGSNAIFHVNTLDQLNSGVILTNWSKMTLFFNNSKCDGWELTISADNVALVSSTDTIPLTSLLIEPTVTNQVNETSLQISSTSFSPSIADTWMLKGTGINAVEIELSLTYKLGTVTSLLNFDSGYYLVGLSLNLSPINYIP